MMLRVVVSDGLGKELGHADLQLDWLKMRWKGNGSALEFFRARISRSATGSFERKSWGVIQMRDESATGDNEVVAILWDAPANSSDKQRIAGRGRLHVPRDSRLRDGKLRWNVLAYSSPTLSELRRRARVVLQQVLPAPYGSQRYLANPFHVTRDSQRATPGYTTCGEFPAYFLYLLAAKKPVIGPGVYALRTQAQARQAWVRYDGSRRPLPGDCYALCKTAKRDDSISHVGVIDDPTSSTWRTGDWGQPFPGKPSGWNGAFVVRDFHRGDGLLTGEAASGGGVAPRALLGWLDLDALMS